jgi:hypothetical protein
VRRQPYFRNCFVVFGLSDSTKSNLKDWFCFFCFDTFKEKINMKKTFFIICLAVWNIASAQPDIIGLPKFVSEVRVRNEYPMFKDHSHCSETMCEYWNTSDPKSAIQTMLVYYDKDNNVKSLAMTVAINELGKYMLPLKDFNIDCELSKGSICWVGATKVYFISLNGSESFTISVMKY